VKVDCRDGEDCGIHRDESSGSCSCHAHLIGGDVQLELHHHEQRDDKEKSAYQDPPKLAVRGRPHLSTELAPGDWWTG
ncbi:hypothetical protein, partial [Listeria monocytogenes]|uniref:hypothetical protein n=1 Tax=Listeria monocytogenes TaxID=1639 RepID=UPI001A9C8A54